MSEITTIENNNELKERSLDSNVLVASASASGSAPMPPTTTFTKKSGPTVISPKQFYGNHLGVEDSTSSLLKSPNISYHDKFVANSINSGQKNHQKTKKKPYDKSTTTTSSSNSLYNNNDHNQQQQVTNKNSHLQMKCTLSMDTESRFIAEPSKFNRQLIEIFKTIPSRSYAPTTKLWTFNLNDYDLLHTKLLLLSSELPLIIVPIPKCVLELLKVSASTEDSHENHNSSNAMLTSIESTLIKTLLPFQLDGVRFGIKKHGRCLIADEMGLGKTYQALALADFYRENWPLLICTTATVRETWFNKIIELLPYVKQNQNNILCMMTSVQEHLGDAKILILTYSLMEKNLQRLLSKKFGFIIFDESHIIKNAKAKCAQAALELAKKAKRVVLLSGTPALSRPCELFNQIHIIDPKFITFKEYSTRYCAGKQTKFGWDATGKSNLNELNIILNRKFMIRRVKQDVLKELNAKNRESVILDPKLIWRNDDSENNMKCYADDYLKFSGKEREEILLRFYSETANVKCYAVAEYVKDVLKTHEKFIVFAHHYVMLNKISKCLKVANVNFIRIDGTTKNREELINRFQNESDCRVAVLSLKACNAGISLTAAQLVLFAELDWNPSTLAQAESRVHRIGQIGTVTCRYLIASNTVDDIIWRMLQRKQDILIEAGLFDDDSEKCKHITIKQAGINEGEVADKKEAEFVDGKAEAVGNSANKTKSTVLSTTTAFSNDHHCIDDNNDMDLLLDADDDLFLNL